MSIVIVLALVCATIGVLASERLPGEVVSPLLIVTLVVTGVLTPQQAFSGFASTTLLMIAGVMLLSGALVRNGVAEMIARKIEVWARGGEGRLAVFLIGSVNLVSSVINNVAATAIFMPVAEGMARRLGRPRSRYLMPVAFASMTGGMCTVIGTSTNIAVSGEMSRRGLVGLGMFELTPLGLVVAVVVGAYLLLVAPHLLARTRPAAGSSVRAFLFEVLVDGPPIAGKTVEQSGLQARFGIEVLAILRDARRIDAPNADQSIEVGDHLIVKGDTAGLEQIRSITGLRLKALPAKDADEVESRMLEITVSFNSPLIGRTLKEVNFRRAHGVSVLAIRHREGLGVEKVGKIEIAAGDVLLAYGTLGAFGALAGAPTALIVETPPTLSYTPRKALLSTLILAGTIAVAAFGWVDTGTAFIGGAALVMLVRLLPVEDAGDYLNLRFLVLIAGVSALGLAMEQSGAAAFLAEKAVLVTGTHRPYLVMAVLFVLTTLMTQPLNNAAAGLIMLPIAIEVAGLLGLDPRAFAVAVAVAASCSFITPFEPACLLVYGTGQYRFLDFFRVGIGATVIVALLCLLLIPVLWPLRAV